ncbi:hypothetical protein BD311DRAFT_769109 [Dichomitus squalens]|uniref:Uncharacterized protein n=1 Tax=Dichomitus squalens TaxID=114155 RepID=A0A4V2JZ11_9APHY|nr:hypothetical protein BD311DRAFT_769109 [Dichomitus squalens]
MWDAQTREPVGECLYNPFGGIDSLALSPDGRHIISSSDTSNRIIVWDMEAFTDPHKAHPSFFNATTTSAAEDPSVLSPLKYEAWNGWITDNNNHLLMWVPDEYRDCLLWRGMVKVMGCESITIDFSNACSGNGWANCYQPQRSTSA